MSSQISLLSIQSADLLSDQQLDISKLMDNMLKSIGSEQDGSEEEKPLALDEECVATVENGGLTLVEIPADYHSRPELISDSDHLVSSQASRQLATPSDDDEAAAPAGQMGNVASNDPDDSIFDATGSFSDPPEEINTPLDHERELIGAMRNAQERLHANFDVTIGNEIDISSMVGQLQGDETVKRAIVNSYATHMEEMKQLRLAFRQYAAAFEETKKLPNYMDIVSDRNLSSLFHLQSL